MQEGSIERWTAEQGTFDSIEEKRNTLHDALNRILATPMKELPKEKRQKLFEMIDGGLGSILDKLKQEGI